MFHKQEEFNPSDKDYSDIPEELYQKNRKEYGINTIKRLEKLGNMITTQSFPDFTLYKFIEKVLIYWYSY